MAPGPRDLARVAVALDTGDWERFRGWCATFGPRVGWLKVGLEAFAAFGARGVEEAARHAEVFLDVKLHDIPNTVAGALRALRGLPVDLVTVHAGGGGAMLRAAQEAAAGRLRLLGVTLLTHLDEAALGELDLPGEAGARVERWAELAVRHGCAGVVCSPREAAALRARLGAAALLVTPGIRPGGSPAGDQRRVATPAEALAAGADVLVVGRPLTAAGDPGTALAALSGELAAAHAPLGHPRR